MLEVWLTSDKARKMTTKIMYVVEHETGGFYLARNNAEDRLSYLEFMNLLMKMKRAVPNRLDYVKSQPVYVFEDRMRMLDLIKREGLVPDFINRIS